MAQLRNSPKAAKPADGGEQPVLLRRMGSASGAGSAPGLMTEPGKSLARAFENMLHHLGAKVAKVAAEPAEDASEAGWRAHVDAMMIWHVQVPGFREGLEIAAPRALLLQLLDIYYGGSGTAAATREGWSPAEARFAQRLGPMLVQALGSALTEFLSGTPHITGFAATGVRPGTTSWTSPLLRQDFRIHGFGPRGTMIAAALSASDAALLHAAHGSAPAAPPPACDGGWRAALHRSLGSVSVPVRSVLARPEITLGRLLALQVGDVIPLKLPEHVPISVAGFRLAAGTIGEAGGRTAIAVNHIRKGPSA
jgi:flagellar motor switch protein FliM